MVEVEVFVYSLLVRWSWCWFGSLFGRGGLCLYPSLVEVICGCLATGLPLLCEVVIVLPQWRLYWLREEFGTPGCICTKSSVEVPSVGVLGGQVSGLEILLGEGGDVELGARTSKHILLFAFNPLTLYSLSLYLCCASFISFIYYMLVLCLASFILFIPIYAWLCLLYTSPSPRDS